MSCVFCLGCFCLGCFYLVGFYLVSFYLRAARDGWVLDCVRVGRRERDLRMVLLMGMGGWRGSDLGGHYDRNQTRMVDKVRYGFRWGLGPNQTDPGCDVTCCVM